MGDAGQVGQSHTLSLVIWWLISLHLPSRISLLLSTPTLRMQPRSPRTPLSDPGPLGSHGLAFSKLLRVFASCVQNPLLCSDLLACMSLRHSLTFLLQMFVSGCIQTPHLVSVKERKARHTRAGGVPMPPVPACRQGRSVCAPATLTGEAAPPKAQVFPPREKTQMSTGVVQGSLLRRQRHAEELGEALCGKAVKDQ